MFLCWRTSSGHWLSVDRLEGEESDQYVPKMCLLRRIPSGEFSEFVRREKKLHIEDIHTLINYYCVEAKIS